MTDARKEAVELRNEVYLDVSMDSSVLTAAAAELETSLRLAERAIVRGRLLERAQDLIPKTQAHSDLVGLSNLLDEIRAELRGEGDGDAR